MKVLILGSGGMAGHLITSFLQENGYNVTAYTRKSFPLFPNNIIGDITNINQFSNILKKNEYDIIINCIGILNQHAEDNKKEAVFINSYLPHFLVDAIKNKSTKLIHMSTDCVFAGNTGPYKEHAFRDGTTFYDRSKALGEIDDNKNLTIRTSIIGPDINENGIGLFNWFMNQNISVKGFSNAIWTGVTTLTLAKAMDKAIKEGLCGIYNLVNNNNISKYDLLCLFNKYFKNNSINILKDSNLKLDKTLICTRDDFSFKVPSYEEMIQEMKEWIYSHKGLYNYKIF